jgi:hypothetical protein
MALRIDDDAEARCGSSCEGSSWPARMLSFAREPAAEQTAHLDPSWADFQR